MYIQNGLKVPSKTSQNDTPADFGETIPSSLHFHEFCTLSDELRYNLLKISHVAPSEVESIEIPVKIGSEFAEFSYF